ncbi:hypothetical protein C8J30_1115 [Rhodobacter viridis]|uniref:Uncharacterized protein n=1 Tax=Rhodobacter viridis TaxID=1054202 RepID=A0A318TY50_9RHOB|nr:hypothetical protein C8J30_1115 [Rhodobacter viridis]
MVRSFRKNGRKHFGTSSSWQRHDRASAAPSVQGLARMIASFARAAEPGARHQSEDGGEVAQARDGRGHVDRADGTAVHRADRGRRGDGCHIPAAHVAATGRLSLCLAVVDPASDTVRAASVLAASWHLAPAGCRRRQAQAPEVQALPHRPSPAGLEPMATTQARSTSTSLRCRRRRASSICSSESTGLPSSLSLNSLQLLTERRPGRSCRICAKPCPTRSTRF